VTKTEVLQRPFFTDLPRVAGIAAETIAAINRPGTVRLKWHPRYLAAAVASNFIHLSVFPVAGPIALIAVAVFSCLTAGRTPGRFIGKAFFGEKFLFTYREFKFFPTVFAR